MAIYFLDSSAIVKHYHAEVGTAAVDRVLSEPNSRHFIALLAVVEVQSAFVGKAREGQITLTDSANRPPAGGLLSQAPSKGALETSFFIRFLWFANVLFTLSSSNPTVDTA